MCGICGWFDTAGERPPNKGLVKEIPNLTVVWNEAQVDEAVHLHGIPRARTVAVGAHAFDHWFAWEPSTTREEFAAAAGFEPSRALLLYTCSSAFVAREEAAFVRDWLSRLRAHPDERLREAAVMIRPHPQGVTSWDEFHRIRQILLDSGHFGERHGTAIHSRVFEADERGLGYPVDLIPFGRIEDPPREIAWPPDQHVIMKVGGYQEAMAAAETVEIAPGETVKVSSLPGLAVLKLLAWAERGLSDPRDAQDFHVLLKEYANAGNLDRLYGGDGLAVLADAGFDPDLAGAALLGQDCRRIASTQTLDDLQAVLHQPSLRNRLILHMGSNKAYLGANSKVYLDSFEKGLFP